MARGIERRKLFRDDKDRKSFLDRLANILEETQTQCYAWALIPNHFHILLRTGTVPLSKVMRKLMTGYAVTFNQRHKRSGHLFQNRYKSIICEEDPYLLELIRYIHLNPLRAGMVKDLKELDKYPWSGHSAILGRCKNPLIPEVSDQKSEFSNARGPSMPSEGGLPFSRSSGKGKKQQNNPENPARPVKQPAGLPVADRGFTGVNPVQEKPLAEKTIEDVLLHFGETKKVARKRYREFVEKGINQGTRPELQGGGLVRSAGGKKTGLLGRKKEERKKGDERILGSGDFVLSILEETNKAFENRNVSRPAIDAITDEVISCFDITPVLLFSRNRNRQVSKARAAISYLAVREAGYTQEEVSTHLNVSRIAVRSSLQRAEKIIAICRQIWGKIT
jgi:putative transposase